MKGARLFWVAAILLWVAGGCNQGLAPRLAVAGGQPDFLLVLLVVLAPYASRTASTWVGFFAGLVQGAIVGANLAAYVATRTVTGFLVGWLGGLEFEPHPALAAVIAAVATCLAQTMLLFLANPPSIPAFLLATITSAIVNAVVAVPVHMVLARILERPRR